MGDVGLPIFKGLCWLTGLCISFNLMLSGLMLLCEGFFDSSELVQFALEKQFVSFVQFFEVLLHFE